MDRVIEAVNLYLDVNNISQKVLSSKTGINEQVLSALLKGKRRITHMYLARFIAAGVINIDKFPELATEQIRHAKAIADLQSANVDISAAADSIISLINKGIPATQVPKTIRRAA